MTAIQYISQLGAASAWGATDIIPVTQGSSGALTGTTRKLTVAQLFTSPAFTGTTTAAAFVATGAVTLGSALANYVTVAGAATSSPVAVSAAGSDSNITLRLLGKGTGTTEALRLSLGTSSGSPALFDGTRVFFVRSNPTYSGSITTPFFVQTNSSGSATNSGQIVHNLFNTLDTLSATAADSVANLASYFTVNSGSRGARIGFQSSINLTGNTSDPAFNRYFHQAIYGAISASGTAGGTAGPGNEAGNLFGGNVVANLKNGALYWNSIVGFEFGVAASAGSSVLYKNGVQIVQESTDAVAGSQGVDSGLVFCTQQAATTTKWDTGITFGHPFGWWPIKTTGTIIGTNTAAPAGPSFAAAYGVDFTAVTFSTAAFASPSFQVDGSGKVRGAQFEVQSGGPRIVTGTGVPPVVLALPRGSVFLRTDGGVGSTVYVSQGGGTWNAMAGV